MVFRQKIKSPVQIRTGLFRRNEFCRLVCRRNWHDVDATTIAVELHPSIYKCENGVITTKPHVFSWSELGAALANDDITSNDYFAAEFFYAEPFADAITTVFDAALTFLMSHIE